MINKKIYIFFKVTQILISLLTFKFVLQWINKISIINDYFAVIRFNIELGQIYNFLYLNRKSSSTTNPRTQISKVHKTTTQKKNLKYLLLK